MTNLEYCENLIKLATIENQFENEIIEACIDQDEKTAISKVKKYIKFRKKTKYKKR